MKKASGKLAGGTGEDTGLCYYFDWPTTYQYHYQKIVIGWHRLYKALTENDLFLSFVYAEKLWLTSEHIIPVNKDQFYFHRMLSLDSEQESKYLISIEYTGLISEVLKQLVNVG